ncbi:MAG: hypothetical protein ACSLFI_10585 [Solirubrobacterales bacterium]
MLKSRIALLTIGVAIAAAGLLSTAGPAQAGCEYYQPSACRKEKACGKVSVWSEGVRIGTKVLTRGYSCRKARKISRHLNDGRYPGNWRCTGSGEGGYCYKSKSTRYKSWARVKHGRYIRQSNAVG